MDENSYLLIASGWIAWAAKEIISGIINSRIDKNSARAGNYGVIPISKRMRCDGRDRDGNSGTVDYFVGMQKYPQNSDCHRFRIEYDFQLFNDSDTQVVYRDLSVESWGVDGPRMIHSGANISVANKLPGPWDAVKSITVPAHSAVNVRVTLLLGNSFDSAEESIRDIYAGTVPLLKAKTIDEQEREFRVSRSSVAGLNLVVWREGDKFPIYSHYSLNEGGRKAGKKSQARKPELDFEGSGVEAAS